MDKSHRVNHEEILPDINSTGIESRTALHCAVSDNQIGRASCRERV